MRSDLPPTADGRADGSDLRLRVASYNVHRCVGGDGVHDPARVGAVLRELDADVIGLQEVDCGFEPAFDVDQLELLANVAGMTPIEGPTLRGEGGHYGNAILTRVRPTSVRRHDLSVSRREPRGALDVDVDIQGTTIRVIATHLGLRRSERARQARKLAAALSDHARPQTVVVGDFNEWRPRERALVPLSAALGAAPRLRTFPARFPVLPLDRIWAMPPEAIESMSTHASPLASVASDHLPVVAMLRWNTGAASRAYGAAAEGR